MNLDNNASKKKIKIKNLISKKNFPLILVISYIILSLLIFYFGPYVYSEYNINVLFYMFLLLISICTGYLSIKYKPIKLKKVTYNDINIDILNNKINKLIVISIWITLIVSIVYIINQLIILDSFSINKILYNITHIGEVYKNSLQIARESNEKSFIGQINNLIGIFKQIAIIGYFIYKPKKIKKIFILTLLLLVFTIIVFKGTQKELFDLILYYLTSKLILNSKESNIKLLKQIIIGALIIFIIFVCIQISRADAYNLSLQITNNNYFYLNTDNFLFKILPFDMAYYIAIMLQYVSMGYYGLGLCMKLPFVWTYGIGNSFALASYANQYLGITNQTINTYPYRMEAVYGYDAGMYWHTVIPWLSSDFTFTGTLILFFIIARIYAITWKEIQEYNNFWSILLFTNLTSFWIFFVGGNVMFLRRDSAIASSVLILIWLFRRKKYNIIRSYDL